MPQAPQVAVGAAPARMPGRALQTTQQSTLWPPSAGRSGDRDGGDNDHLGRGLGVRTRAINKALAINNTWAINRTPLTSKTLRINRALAINKTLATNEILATHKIRVINTEPSRPSRA